MKHLPLTVILGLILAASPQTENILGNPDDVETETSPGVVLMGGGGEVTEALKWMVDKSHGGDFLVLATSPTAVCEEIFTLGVDSVETLIIDSRDAANAPEIVAKIERAEAIFLPGGSQDDYVRLWKGTKTAEAINLRKNKIPIGGTSAGMAILGEYYYAPKNANSTTTRLSFSLECLADPFHQYINGLGTDFIKIPILKNIITDSHYSERNRAGRHLAFMARLILNFQIKPQEVRGIGVDENTAVCIELPSGKACIFGSGETYFLNGCAEPEVCEERRPLTWNHEKQAVKVYRISTTGKFDLKKWEGSGGSWMYWSVDDGKLHQEARLSPRDRQLTDTSPAS